MSNVNISVIWHRISSTHSLKGYSASLSLDDVLVTSHDQFKLTGLDITDQVQNVTMLLMYTNVHDRLRFTIYGPGNNIMASNSLKMTCVPMNVPIRHQLTLLCYCCPKPLTSSSTKTTSITSTSNSTYQMEFTIKLEPATNEDTLIHHITKLRKVLKIRNNTAIRSAKIGAAELDVIKRALIIYPEFHQIPPMCTSASMLASITTYLWCLSARQGDRNMKYYLSSSKPVPSFDPPTAYRSLKDKCTRGHMFTKPSNNRYALLIGLDYPRISEDKFFSWEGPNIGRCSGDGMRVRQTLVFKSVLLGYYLFSARCIETLTDASSADSKFFASYDNIIREFKKLTNVVSTGDVIVVVICGKGNPGSVGSILTGDMQKLTAANIEDNLVLQLPKGCKLTLIVDTSWTTQIKIDLGFSYDFQKNLRVKSTNKRRIKADVTAICSNGLPPLLLSLCYTSLAMQLALSVVSSKLNVRLRDVFAMLKDKNVLFSTSLYLYPKRMFNLMDGIMVKK